MEGDLVTRLADRLRITCYEVIERAYEHEWGAIIDRQHGAMMEADWRSYNARGHIPQYAAKWCASQLQDDLVEA